ncbi:unnamed protein product [Zymoseptoria tritici ST99CH_3D1]|nr:unnamed protein product [Zymoseptoria tritici ST99CH_3D1]
MLTSLLLTAIGASAAALPSVPSLETRQAPFEVLQAAPWDAGAVTEWQIHPSCNSSERLQLQQGLDEAVTLATHAKAHINRWGNSSEVYRKYFGNSPPFEAAGAYDIIINGDRAGALFRCDDPDGNCAAFPDEWAGHYRGPNGTHETVICPLSYTSRQHLSQICSQGYDVRTGSRTLYWGSDLIHRLYHMPAYGANGYIDHYAEGWAGIVTAAKEGSPNSTHDSDGLQFFALEAYAYDVIYPGVGCPGSNAPVTEEEMEGSGGHGAAAAATTTSMAAAPAAVTDAPAGQDCHTHSDGSIHCSDATTPEPAATSEAPAAGGENCHTHANGELHCT